LLEITKKEPIQKNSEFKIRNSESQILPNTVKNLLEEDLLGTKNLESSLDTKHPPADSKKLIVYSKKLQMTDDEFKNTVLKELKKKHRVLPQSFPTFSGRNDRRSWHQYLREIYDVANSHFLDYEDLCKIIPTCLTGEARVYCDSLPDETRNNWQNFANAFSKEYDESDSSSLRFLTQLMERKQKANETTSEFSAEISRLVDLAYSKQKGFTDENRKSLKISCFVRGLRPELKAELIRNPPTDFQTAVKNAQKEENIFHELKGAENLHTDLLNSISQKIDKLQVNAVQRQFVPTRASWNQNFRGSIRPRGGYQIRSRGYQNDFVRQNFNGQNFNTQPRDMTQQNFINQNTLGQVRNHQPLNRGQRSRNNRGRIRRTGRGRGGYSINTIDTQQNEHLVVPGTSMSTLGTIGTLFNVMSIITLVLISTISGIEAGESTNPKTYMICGKSSTGILVEPPKYQQCEIPTKVDISEVIAFLYVPKAEAYRFEAFRCVKRTMQNCWHQSTDTLSPGEFLTSSDRIGDANAHIEPNYSYNFLSPEECIELNRTRLNLEQIDKFAWADNKISYFEPAIGNAATLGNPFLYMGKNLIAPPTCTPVTSHFLQRGYITTNDGVVLTSALSDLNGCKMSDLSCVIDGGTVIWPKQEPKSFCRLEQKGPYKVYIAGLLVLIDDIKGGFVLENRELTLEEIECTEPGTKPLDSGAYLKILSDSGVFHDREKRQTNETEDYSAEMDEEITLPFLYQKLLRNQLLPPLSQQLPPLPRPQQQLPPLPKPQQQLPPLPKPQQQLPPHPNPQQLLPPLPNPQQLLPPWSQPQQLPLQNQQPP
jgi:hypothetical protein